MSFFANKEIPRGRKWPQKIRASSDHPGSRSRSSGALRVTCFALKGINRTGAKGPAPECQPLGQPSRARSGRPTPAPENRLADAHPFLGKCDGACASSLESRSKPQPAPCAAAAPRTRQIPGRTHCNGTQRSRSCFCKRPSPFVRLRAAWFSHPAGQHSQPNLPLNMPHPGTTRDHSCHEGMPHLGNAASPPGLPRRCVRPTSGLRPSTSRPSTSILKGWPHFSSRCGPAGSSTS